ncbi:MAG: Rieske 2Fe-2S domain-containing protein [Polyangiales bacterium]
MSAQDSDEGAELIPIRRYAKGRFSVARPLARWYVLAASSELRAKPLSRTVFDLPIVLFRDASGEARALLDRCPHRNVALSDGRVTGGELECPYHGWRFDGGGVCRHVPCLVGESSAKARNAVAFPVRELDGYVWVMPSPDAEPAEEPYRFALASDPAYTTVRQAVEAQGTLHAAAENALDVPHTAFLHKGLFRSESRGITLEVRVRRSGDRVEAEYLGEPRPPGIVGRILSPTGGTVQHWDRFIAPCIAEVEYRLGDENHILIATALTPVSDFVTRLYATVSFRLRVPSLLVRAVLPPLALRIFQQDARVLAKQTAQARRFGGEQFAWTDADVLGKHIWWLLRAAERGDSGGESAEVSETVRLVV